MGAHDQDVVVRGLLDQQEAHQTAGRKIEVPLDEAGDRGLRRVLAGGGFDLPVDGEVLAHLLHGHSGDLVVGRAQ